MLPTLDDLGDIENKRVIVRASLNVPIEHDTVIDPRRIEAMLPTIAFLRARGACTIIIGHLGRKGESLAPVARFLDSRMPIRFIGAPLIGDVAREAIASMRGGDVVLLENVRADKREEANDAHYASILASFGDIYVNDTFADSHRAHASLVGIASILPTYFGRSFMREYEKLGRALKPEHPSLCIIGGVKFDTKEKMIEKFAHLYTNVFVAGALMNDIFKARGYETGVSIVSEYPVQLSSLPENAIIPSDVMVTNERGDIRVEKPDCLHSDDMIVDIGPESFATLSRMIGNAKTILWNGPLGYCEGGFDHFTQKCAESIAKRGATTIIGGGDTTASIRRDFLENITHVSTAGGAMLVFLETGTLPVIEVAKKKYTSSTYTIPN